MTPNSFTCKLIKVKAKRKENKEKGIPMEDEICKLTKAPPKDKEALVKRSVLAKDNSEESGIVQPKAEGAFEE
jgi:hypothetical protein